MKKYLNVILAGLAAVAISGCAAFTNWFNSVDWNKVNSVVVPTVQTTAQTTVYLVCEKNPDLKPVFIAAGNGILLAVANSQFNSTQIKTYINEALGEENVKYFPLVVNAMDTLIASYTCFYTINWKETESAEEKASIESVMSKYLSAIATGVINGAEMSAAQYKQLVSTNSNTIEEVSKLQVILK